MPQVNIYTYLTQTSWTIIIFFLFYYCLKQYLFPVIHENILLKNESLKLTSKVTSSNPSHSSNNLTTYDNIL